MTIKGTSFGFTEGEVLFLGNPADPADDKVAKAPSQCSVGGGTWGNVQVVVAVPDGADGRIEEKMFRVIC